MIIQSKKLSPSIFKYLLLLVICSSFVYLGFFRIEIEPNIAWGTIIFFGLGVIVAILKLIPGSSYLKLTKEGFEIRSLYRSHFTKWNDVENFRVNSIRTWYSYNKMVMFDYHKNHTKYTFGKRLSKALPETYGMSAQKLSELMNEWKSKSIKN
ncbi:STM3941 family protein [Pseudotenacibaculum sp. MALMAid0570]|uniref:STM3941 family protein n=1 Tax=Pseudotenacibaculum sp. MALMAid0570 TaxID=3143938 RepID=UPI0032DEF702